jgi:hypothetical protein
MNKYKKLQKELIKKGLLTLAIVLAFAALFFVAGEFEDRKIKGKTDAEAALASDKTQETNLKNQLTQSSTAEKRFAEIQMGHENADYTANNEGIKAWLRNAKSAYRFSNDFKLSITPEKPSDKTELNGLAYDITMRPEMKIEFQAISDMHVFSFLKDFIKQAPGVVRIDAISLKRKGDMDNTAVSQLTAGQAVFMVDASIKFSWIGIAPKEAKSDAKEPAK